MAIKLQPIRQNLLHSRPRHLPWLNSFATRMLARDLFAVANLLVELSSVKHASQKHQHNCHQYNTYSNRIRFRLRLCPNPAGELTTFPDFVIG